MVRIRFRLFNSWSESGKNGGKIISNSFATFVKNPFHQNKHRLIIFCFTKTREDLVAISVIKSLSHLEHSIIIRSEIQTSFVVLASVTGLCTFKSGEWDSGSVFIAYNEGILLI